MSEFPTIKECIQAFLKDPTDKNHAFICTVIKASDLKSGTGDKGDWTKKVFTVEDATDQIDITLWGKNVDLLKLGYKYEITNAYFSTYKDDVQVGLTYGQVKMIGSAGAPKEQSTLEAPEPTPKPAVGKPAEEIKLPTVPEGFLNFIENETIVLLQIERDVKSVMAHYGTKLETVDGGKIGMFVKEIYRESKKIKFEKA